MGSSKITSCPFCKLHQGILKANDLAIVFLSNPRKMPGHFLVAPKRHVEKPWELSKQEIAAVFDLVFFVQKRVVEKLSSGCDVRQNYRPFLKQSRLKIDHVHYHVMPRDAEDEVYNKAEQHEKALFADLSSEEHDEMAKLLVE